MGMIIDMMLRLILRLAGVVAMLAIRLALLLGRMAGAGLLALLRLVLLRIRQSAARRSVRGVTPEPGSQPPMPRTVQAKTAAIIGRRAAPVFRPSTASRIGSTQSRLESGLPRRPGR